MATEKTWRCRINKNCNGDDGTATAQNWMFEYFTFLSGGEGGVGAWTIMSSSDASTVVSGGINITAASDFTFAVSGSKHSWFVARKNILPIGSGSSTYKDAHQYLYHGVNCNSVAGTNDHKATFWWDHQDPASHHRGGGQGNTGSINHSITGSVYTYAAWRRYRADFDAANPTYFHGTMDTTGSHHVVTATRNSAQHSMGFALTCARVETPRSSSIEHFPIFLKCGYNTYDDALAGAYHKGPWSFFQTSEETKTPWNTSDTAARNTALGYGAQQAVWRYDGAWNDDLEVALMFPIPWEGGGLESVLNYFTPAVGGPPVDGSWSFMPVFLQSVDPNATVNAAIGKHNRLVGRLPDVHPWNESYDAKVGAGATVPYPTSSVTHAVVGNYFLPFTGALLPGD